MQISTGSQHSAVVSVMAGVIGDVPADLVQPSSTESGVRSRALGAAAQPLGVDPFLSLPAATQLVALKQDTAFSQS